MHGNLTSLYFVFGVGTTARIQAVLGDMQQVLQEDPSSKFVIFSQYAEYLLVLQAKLEGVSIGQTRLKCVVVTSNMNIVDKDAKQAAFNTPSSTTSQHSSAAANGSSLCNVCMIQLGAGSAGLTLTTARVCYLLEPTHSAADEAQALNRIHRIGQTQSVRCVIFYVRNTIEERILAIRKHKGTLTSLLEQRTVASEVKEEDFLGDPTGTTFFSMSNLKFLFGYCP